MGEGQDRRSSVGLIGLNCVLWLVWMTAAAFLAFALLGVMALVFIGAIMDGPAPALGAIASMVLANAAVLGAIMLAAGWVGARVLRRFGLATTPWWTGSAIASALWVIGAVRFWPPGAGPGTVVSGAPWLVNLVVTVLLVVTPVIVGQALSVRGAGSIEQAHRADAVS